MQLIEIQRTYKLTSGQQITIAFEIGEGSIMLVRGLDVAGPDGEIESTISLSPMDCQQLGNILCRTSGDNHE